MPGQGDRRTERDTAVGARCVPQLAVRRHAVAALGPDRVHVGAIGTQGHPGGLIGGGIRQPLAGGPGDTGIGRGPHEDPEVATRYLPVGRHGAGGAGECQTTRPRGRESRGGQMLRRVRDEVRGIDRCHEDEAEGHGHDRDESPSDRHLVPLLFAVRARVRGEESTPRDLRGSLSRNVPVAPGTTGCQIARPVGWSIDAAPTAALVTRALDMATDQRSPDGTIIHSNQGTQTRSWAFTRRAINSGLMPSTGRCRQLLRQRDDRVVLEQDAGRTPRPAAPRGRRPPSTVVPPSVRTWRASLPDPGGWDPAAAGIAPARREHTRAPLIPDIRPRSMAISLTPRAGSDPPGAAAAPRGRRRRPPGHRRPADRSAPRWPRRWRPRACRPRPAPARRRDRWRGC